MSEEQKNNELPKEPVKEKVSPVERRPNFLVLLNPFRLKKEINTLTADAFKASAYIKYLIFCFVGMFGCCYVFKLQLPFAIALFVLMALFLPSLYYISSRNKYEHQRFMDVSSYVEQLLYSFKRQPKILVALQDTAVLFEDDEKNSRLSQCIKEAIQFIQNGVAEENIYKEAFAIIEAEFGCKRMYKVHEFLIRVENAGGVADEAIEMLIKDRNLWVTRIQNLLQDKQKVRINVGIGIGLSILIVGMGTYMVPADFGIHTMFASQLAKTITFIMDMAIFYGVQVALSKSLLGVDQNLPFEEIERAYNLVMHDTYKKKNKTFLIAAGITLVGAVVAFFAMGITPAVIIAIFALMLVTQPKRQYKACFKRVYREVEKAFPDWMLSLALQMQTDNVHVSIAKTAIDAPRILMEELATFQDELEKHPNALSPYTNFFKKLEIPDVVTAMKMLYAMAEFGAKDSQEQIKGLVNRNTEAMDKADRMRMEDSLAGISFAMLLPMITGVIPLLVDLALVMTYILSQVNA